MKMNESDGLVSAFIVHNTKGCILCRSWVSYCDTLSSTHSKVFLQPTFWRKLHTRHHFENDWSWKSVYLFYVTCLHHTCTFSSPFAIKSVSVKASDPNKRCKTSDIWTIIYWSMTAYTDVNGASIKVLLWIQLLPLNQPYA